MIKIFSVYVFNTCDLNKIIAKLVKVVFQFLCYFTFIFASTYIMEKKIPYEYISIIPVIWILLGSVYLLICMEDFSVIGFYNQIYLKPSFRFLVASAKYLISDFFLFSLSVVIVLHVLLRVEIYSILILEIYFVTKSLFFNSISRNKKYVFISLFAMSIEFSLFFAGTNLFNFIILLLGIVFLVFFCIFRNNIYEPLNSWCKRKRVLSSDIKEVIQIYYLNFVFLIRCKKKWFITSFVVFLMAYAFFILFSCSYPEVLYEYKFQVLLFYALATASFEAILGPYILKWVVYYYDDLLSKNISLKTILKSQKYFFDLSVLISFILYIPIILIFDISFLRFLYFTICNVFLTSYSAVFVSLLLFSFSDSNINPRLFDEKGNFYSSFLPWISVLINIVIYENISPIIGDEYLLLATVILFISSIFLQDRILAFIVRIFNDINYRKENRQ